MYNPCIRKDREGVSPVIAVILLVAITVVLVATLYFAVSGLVEETQQTPVAALIFEESSDIPGKYTGWVQSITAKVYLDDVSATIVDIETAEAAIIYPLADGASAQIGTPGIGFNLTFHDIGLKGRLDGNDIFYVYQGSHGDRITLTYIPTDDLLCYAELFD